MVDNQKNITSLYVLNSDESITRINPETIAVAVTDEKIRDPQSELMQTVQDFINNGLKGWDEEITDYQYATSIFVKEELTNCVKYMGEWNTDDNKFILLSNEEDENELTNDDEINELETNEIVKSDFPQILLPIRKGYGYKVIGSGRVIDGEEYFEGDFIIITEDVPAGGIITKDIVFHLKCSGKGNKKLDKVVVDVVQTYQDLLDYSTTEKPTINDIDTGSIIIVANDETHGKLLSFYECVEYYDLEFNTKADLNEYLETAGELDVDGYDFVVDETNHMITLNSYIGSNINVPAPQITGGGLTSFIAKVISDESYNGKTTFYNCENKILSDPSLHNNIWEYKLSRKESGIFHLKGSVQTYYDLPDSGQVEGDVWNIIEGDIDHHIDPGENVVWVDEHDGIPAHWDDFGGIIDISNYYTKEEIDGKITEINTNINNLHNKITVENDGNYIQSGDEVANNLELLDEEVQLNADNIADIQENITLDYDGYYVLEQNDVKDNLLALDAQVKLNSDAIENLPPAVILRKWQDNTIDLSDWEYTNINGDVILNTYIGEGLSIDVPQVN